MFHDFRVPPERLLQLVRPGGIVILDGGFNAQDYDVEVRFRLRKGNDHKTTEWRFGLQPVCARRSFRVVDDSQVEP
jgi:hypothetical protein